MKIYLRKILQQKQFHIDNRRPQSQYAFVLTNRTSTNEFNRPKINRTEILQLRFSKVHFNGCFNGEKTKLLNFEQKFRVEKIQVEKTVLTKSTRDSTRKFEHEKIHVRATTTTA